MLNGNLPMQAKYERSLEQILLSIYWQFWVILRNSGDYLKWNKCDYSHQLHIKVSMCSFITAANPRTDQLVHSQLRRNPLSPWITEHSITLIKALLFNLFSTEFSFLFNAVALSDTYALWRIHTYIYEEVRKRYCDKKNAGGSVN